MNTTLLQELGVIRIASPCDVPWSSMKGTNAVRFCDQCRLNVYNVEELSSYEVRELILKTEGRVCMRLFKRFDGTLLTKDCPRGLAVFGQVWRQSRQRAETVGVASYVAVIMAIAVSAIAIITYFGDNIRRLWGMEAGALSGDIVTTTPPPSFFKDPRAAVLARFNAWPPEH
jgi:hypothetical protein